MSCKFDTRKALTAGALKTPVKVSEQSTLPELGCKTDGCRDVWHILINAVCTYSDPILMIKILRQVNDEIFITLKQKDNCSVKLHQLILIERFHSFTTANYFASLFWSHSARKFSFKFSCKSLHVEVDNITHKTTPKRTGCVTIDINWNARSQLLHDNSLTIKYKTCFWDFYQCSDCVQQKYSMYVWAPSVIMKWITHVTKKLQTNNIYTWSEKTAEII